MIFKTNKLKHKIMKNSLFSSKSVSKRTVKLSLIGVFFTSVILLLISCGKDIIPTPVPTLPTVSTADVTNVTLNSATLGGNVSSDGNALVTSRGVCFGLTSNPTISDSKTTDGVGIGNFASSLNGLTPGTTYNVRAYATNSVGIGYGNNVSFTTTAIMYPVTITYGSNGTASSTLKEVASGGTLPITVTANPGFIPDSVKVNGVIFPLGRSITTYNLTNVTKATTAHFTFRVDLNAIINQKAWKKDSLWMEKDDGTWQKSSFEKKDSVLFLSTGRYAIYRDKILIGDGNWSIIENFKVIPVLNFGGSIWDIERLDSNNLIIVREASNIDPKITKKILVKEIYNRYPSGK